MFLDGDGENSGVGGEETFILITCYISSAYILKYMIQLVIEGKIRRQNMSIYDITLCNKINTK